MKAKFFFIKFIQLIGLLASAILLLVSFSTGFFMSTVDNDTLRDWELFTAWRPWYYKFTGPDLTNIHIATAIMFVLTITFLILGFKIWDSYSKD